MKKSIRFFLIFTALIISSVDSYCQGTNQATNTISLGMPEVLLIKTNLAGDINLTLTPQEAGQAVEASKSDESARILISSVVSGDQTRNLSASVTTGDIPGGTYLRLSALSPSGSFIGTQGTLAGEIELEKAVEKNIVTGIGTCYSGTGEFDGYVLKYTFGVLTASESYSLIRASIGTKVTVTITLSTGA